MLTIEVLTILSLASTLDVPLHTVEEVLIRLLGVTIGHSVVEVEVMLEFRRLLHLGKQKVAQRGFTNRFLHTINHHVPDIKE